MLPFLNLNCLLSLGMERHPHLHSTRSPNKRMSDHTGVWSRGWLLRPESLPEARGARGSSPRSHTPMGSCPCRSLLCPWAPSSVSPNLVIYQNPLRPTHTHTRTTHTHTPHTIHPHTWAFVIKKNPQNYNNISKKYNMYRVFKEVCSTPRKNCHFNFVNVYLR